MRKAFIITLMLPLVSGCLIVPLPSKVTHGPQFSREALAFLDAPGTTRGDVLESLGSPLIEVRDPGTLVYVSEISGRALVIDPKIEPDTPPRVESAVSRESALFVAYDARGLVIAHETVLSSPEDLKSACMEWRNKQNHNQ